MVLLEGYMGRFLHTGDMRYCPSMQRLPLAESPLDILILDNTYCDPIYQFGPRSESALMALEIIQTYRKEG